MTKHIQIKCPSSPNFQAINPTTNSKCMAQFCTQVLFSRLPHALSNHPALDLPDIHATPTAFGRLAGTQQQTGI